MNFISNLKSSRFIFQTCNFIIPFSGLFKSYCYGLTPANNSAPCSCLLTLPSCREKRIRKLKMSKLMGWDRKSLIGKPKAMCASKAKQRNHSPLPMGRQVLSHPLESRAPSHPGVIRGKKMPALSIPHSLLASALYAEHVFIWHGIFLCSPVSPPKFFAYSQPSSLMGGCEKQKIWASTAQQYIKHTWIINIAFSPNPKLNPILATRREINSTLAKTSTTVYLQIFLHLLNKLSRVSSLSRSERDVLPDFGSCF